MIYPERKRQRLKDYDYTSPGDYFVTICVHHQFKEFYIFGKVEDGKIKLNDCGEVVTACWLDLPNHYFNIKLDEFIIMPNHVHGIIKIIDNENHDCNDIVGNSISVGNGFKSFPKSNMRIPFPENTTDVASISDGIKKHGLPEIIRGFKTFSSRRINESKFQQRFQWQKSFHDIIIRNDITLRTIRKYIRDNPKNADMCGNEI